MEWIIKNVSQKMQHCMDGHALMSPSFNAHVPTIGEVKELKLAFYPRGERGGPNCSLYLEHPVDAPWMRFFLTIGSQKRGPFDTIYKGPPNFCNVGPEINEGLPSAWDAVRLSVEFISPITERESTADLEEIQNRLTRRSVVSATAIGITSLQHQSLYLPTPQICSTPSKKWPSLLA